MKNMVEYEKHQIIAQSLVSPQVVKDLGKDYAYGLLKYEIRASILSKTKDVQIVDYTFNRPTFLEWLLRKKRTVSIQIKIKDVLKNPPMLNNRDYRIYECETIEELDEAK